MEPKEIIEAVDRVKKDLDAAGNLTPKSGTILSLISLVFLEVEAHRLTAANER